MASIAGIGATGFGLYNASRGRSAAAVTARTAARTAANVGRLLGAVRLLTGLTAIGVGLTGLSLLTRRRGQSRAAPEQKTVDLLTDLVIQSTKSRQSLETIVVRQRQATDPIGRDLGFQRSRLAFLGALPDRRDIENALAWTEINRDMADLYRAMAADARRFSPSRAIDELFIQPTARTLVNVRAAFAETQRQQDRFFYEQIPSQIGFWLSGTRVLGGPAPGARRDEATENPLLAEQVRGMQEARARRNQLLALQTLGVPQVPAAPRFVGGEGVYAARVQAERGRLQQLQTQQYWERVIALLEEMVQKDNLDQAVVEETRVRANPAAFTVGVE